MVKKLSEINTELDLNSDQFQIFSTSLGAFLPINYCFKDSTIYYAGCKEDDLCQNPNNCSIPKNSVDIFDEDNKEESSPCTQLEYGGSDDICSKLNVSKNKMNTHVCIKDTPQFNLTLCEDNPSNNVLSTSSSKDFK
jgi:hypothetical protein